MLKGNNKDTRTASLLKFPLKSSKNHRFSSVLTIAFSIVSIVDFEQVNVC